MEKKPKSKTKNKKKAAIASILPWLAAAALVVVALYAVLRKKDLNKMSIQELEDAMNKCCHPAVEDYEMAAKIRDLIAQKKSHINQP